MEKILSILLALILVSCLCVCSVCASGEPADTPATTSASAQAADVEAALTAGSEEDPCPVTDGTPDSTADGWAKSGGTWYYYRDGSRVTGWLQLGSIWYYLDADRQGAMVTGWQQIDGIWYYFGTWGAMATGWQYITPSWSDTGLWYYFKSWGALATGWQQVNGSWYFLNNEFSNPEYCYMLSSWYVTSGGNSYLLGRWGAMVTSPGWHSVSVADDGSTPGYWFYVPDESGQLAVGWKIIGGTWYYFDQNGIMTANTCIDTGDGSYAFDKSGAWIRQTGWIKFTDDYTDEDGTTVTDTWWAYSEDGRSLVTGQKRIGGVWYRFYDSGEMLQSTVYVTWDGHRYIYNSSGALVQGTGWVRLPYADGTCGWAYAQNGEALTGWQTIGGAQYYLGDYGLLVCGRTEEIDGHLYLFNSLGQRMTNGWAKVNISGGSYDWAYAKDGYAVTGTQTIGGVRYTFDEYGILA